MVVVCEMRGAASWLICSKSIRVYLVGKILCGLIYLVSRDSLVSVEANCGGESWVCLVGCCGMESTVSSWLDGRRPLLMRSIFPSPGFIAREFLVGIDHDEEATCVF